MNLINPASNGAPFGLYTASSRDASSLTSVRAMIA